MSQKATVLAERVERYPAEVSVCIIGAACAAAGIAIFAIAGASGVGAAAVWVLAAILTVTGLAFIAYIIRDFIRYRRTPRAVIEYRDGRLFVLGREGDIFAITHVSVNEARGHKGPLGWGSLVLRSGAGQTVCRYIKDVEEAQARMVKFLATQRRRSENNG